MSKLSTYLKAEPDFARKLAGIMVATSLAIPASALPALADSASIDKATRAAIIHIKKLDDDYKVIARFIRQGKLDEAHQYTAALNATVSAALASTGDSMPGMVITSALDQLETAIARGKKSDIQNSIETFKDSLETSDYEMTSAMRF